MNSEYQTLNNMDPDQVMFASKLKIYSKMHLNICSIPCVGPDGGQGVTGICKLSANLILHENWCFIEFIKRVEELF